MLQNNKESDQMLVLNTFLRIGGLAWKKHHTKDVVSDLFSLLSGVLVHQASWTKEKGAKYLKNLLVKSLIPANGTPITS